MRFERDPHVIETFRQTPQTAINLGLPTQVPDEPGCARCERHIESQRRTGDGQVL